MADSMATPETEGTTTQTASMEQSGATEAFEPIMSQEEFDERIKARIKRVKATPPADYDELKAKAAKFDELEAANKSDLERANDALSKAKAKADEWKAKFETLQAEQERSRQIAEMAAKYGVDLGTLARMTGEVEDNAKYLANLEAAKPKHGNLPDNGEQRVPQTLESQLKEAKTDRERIQIRAAWKAAHRK